MLNPRILFLALAALALTGCANFPSRTPPIELHDDMDRQLKYKAQTLYRGEGIFDDARANRMPVPGTVAVGYLKDNDAETRGIVNGQYVGTNPMKIDAALLKTGQAKFNTYCSPCHDRTGSGQGVVPKRTLWLPTNLHEDRIVAMSDGEVYDVISNGRRTMHGYKYQIVEADRWAIVAYVRALQRSDRGTLAEVPAELRGDLR
ncbi:MAG: cytochrome c [Bryobacter sp.]|nr:cytochrome c [Bryobacter sp.]